MKMWLRQRLAPPVFAGDEEKTRVAGLVNTILLALVVLITLVALIVAIALRNYAMMTALYVSMMLPVSVSLWALRRGYVRAAALIITTALWLVLVVSGAFIGGVINAGYTTVILVIIVAALLLGGRVGLIAAGISIVAVIIVYISELMGILPPPLRADDSTSFFINHVLNYGVSGALLYMATNSLTTALHRARRLTAESEAQREQLQILVQQRTQDSERSASYLQATTAVARESVAAMGDLQALFARVVDIIREQFGFYHVGLYLIDEAAEWVELRAVSGAGHELIERGLRLRAGAEGIIGDVARRGVYRLTADVDQDSTYLRVDELPDTRAELALPLQMRNQIIGVLDVQSVAAGAFAEQNVQTLQALADQTAMAISNARLVEQVQQTAEVERRMYGAQTGAAWQNLLRASQSLGFYSNERTTAPAGDLWQPEMKTALQTGGTIQDPHNAQWLAVPVKVRDEVIGVIDFAKPSTGGAWTAEEIALMESLTEQLGIALESARLYQDTQRRAARERVLREFADQMQRASDIQTLIRATAEELNRILGGSRSYVRLGTEALLSSNDAKSSGEGDD